MSNAKLVTKDDLKEMYQRILPYLGGSADAGFTPIGTIIAVMGNDAPANYLPCDGRVVNISDYPELADYFKEQFGSSNYFGGDGTTTFGIVDLSGEFLRGAGTNSHSGQGSGAEVGEHQNATEIQASQSNNNTLFEYCGNQGDSWNKRYKDADYEVAVANGSYYRVSGTYNEANDAGGITTRPTNTSVLFCIATKNIYLNPSTMVKLYEGNSPAVANTNKLQSTSPMVELAQSIENFSRVLIVHMFNDKSSTDGGVVTAQVEFPVDIIKNYYTHALIETSNVAAEGVSNNKISIMARSSWAFYDATHIGNTWIAMGGSTTWALGTNKLYVYGIV